MTKKEKKYSKYYVDRLKSIIKRLECNASKNHITKEENSGKSKSHRLKKYALIINIPLAIATIVIAGYAIAQYASFKKFTKKNNRAYLVVTDPILDTFKYVITKGDTIKIPRVTYTVKNTGKTPAYSVRDSVFFEYNLKKLGPIIPNTTKPFSQWLYGPGQTKRIKLFKQLAILPIAIPCVFSSLVELNTWIFSEILSGLLIVLNSYIFMRVHSFHIGIVTMEIKINPTPIIFRELCGLNLNSCDNTDNKRFHLTKGGCFLRLFCDLSALSYFLFVTALSSFASETCAVRRN